MLVEKPSRVPKLRTRETTGQDYVMPKGQAIYLGCAGLPETDRRYRRVIPALLSSGFLSAAAAFRARGGTSF